MRQIMLIMLVALSNSLCFSQQPANQKIVEAYGQAYTQQLTQAMPAVIELMNKYLNYGFFVQTASNTKYATLPAIDSIPLRNSSGHFSSIQAFLADVESPTFNPLKYAFFPQEGAQVYRLNGVDKLIYIAPKNTILSH